MDVYQKVLVKVYEIAGSKENTDVDMVDLLKREGFFPSMTDILEKLGAEGWITETSPKTVRLTHWGIMAARKLKSATPDSANAVGKHANQLKSEVKEFSILVEEFNGDSTSDNFGRLDKKLAEINAVATKIRENM